LKEFISFQIGIIFHPIITFRKILRHEKRFSFGFITILLFGTGYTIGVIFAYSFGHHPYGIPIVLKIPIEQYYLYEAFFLLLLTISTWILLAGLIRIISIPFKGKGSYEDTLSLLGFPFIILLLFMLIPDIINDYLFKKIITNNIYWNIINPIRLFIPTLWVMILHFLAIKEVQGINNFKTLIVFIIAYIPYIALVMTYIR
jgi:hypothetical protein